MKINMSHGSGGVNSKMLMDEVFGKHFKNPVLDRLEDGAVLEIRGGLAYSTDSFVVTPLFFRGGDIGKLSICGTANDLAMMGGVPKFFTCGFILEEGLEVETLENIVISMAKTAEEIGISIVAGDTKVVEGRGGIYINTSGIGLIPEGRVASSTSCISGDGILISGTVGDHQSCILSTRMGIENQIESDCCYLGNIVERLYEEGIRIRCMRDVTRGGLATVLNELAEASRVKFQIDEEGVPIDDGVRGLSQILGLDPLYMANEGKFLLVVDGEDVDEGLRIMRGMPHGENAELIGRVIDGQGVEMKLANGGSRRLDSLYGEGLPRIC